MGVSSAQRQRLLNTCPPFPLASKVYVLLKSLQVSALQRLSFQQTPSPKPSSTFPTSFSAQEIKTTARKQPQPAASSEQNSRPLRTPEASAPREALPGSLPSHPTHPLPYLIPALPGAPSLCLSSGLWSTAGSPGAPAQGLGPQTLPGPPPRGGSQQATLSQRPGSKISFLEDLAWALPSSILRETASTMRTATQRGLPAQSGNNSVEIFYLVGF